MRGSSGMSKVLRAAPSLPMWEQAPLGLYHGPLVSQLDWAWMLKRGVAETARKTRTRSG